MTDDLNDLMAEAMAGLDSAKVAEFEGVKMRDGSIAIEMPRGLAERLGLAMNQSAENLVTIISHPEVSEEMKKHAMTNLLRDYDPYIVCMAMYPAPYPLIKELHRSYVMKGNTTLRCPCGKNMTDCQGFTRHFARCEQAQKASQEMEAAFPTHPSNRTFLNQLGRWNVVIEKVKGDWTSVRFPNGEKLQVRSANYHDGNSTHTFSEVVRILGLTPEMFWQGPPETPKPALKVVDQKYPARKSYIGKVADCLVQFGAPMSVDLVAKELGLDHSQARQALGRLVKQGFAEVAAYGVYVAKQHAAEHRVDIDIDVNHGDRGQEPRIAPQEPAVAPTAVSPVPDSRKSSESVLEPGSAQDVDSLVESVLDLLFPQGLRIKASDVKAVNDWIEATKHLLRRVRSDG